MKILVIGNNGYIGTVLTEIFISNELKKTGI